MGLWANREAVAHQQQALGALRHVLETMTLDIGMAQEHRLATACRR